MPGRPATAPGAPAAARRQRPAPDAELAGRLRIVLTRLAHALRAQDAEAGLTQTRIATLSVLDTSGPLRLGELAARIGTSAPTMTRLVDCLAELGHVGREPDPDDHRATRVSIGPAGSALLSTLRRRGTGLIAERLRTLAPAEIETLAAAVPLLEALADARGDGGHT